MTTRKRDSHSWPGVGERIPASDRNRSGIKRNLHLRLTHHTVWLYLHRDFRDYLYTLAARTRGTPRGPLKGLQPHQIGFQPPTLVHGRAHVQFMRRIPCAQLHVVQRPSIRIPGDGNANEVQGFVVSSGSTRVTPDVRGTTGERGRRDFGDGNGGAGTGVTELLMQCFCRGFVEIFGGSFFRYLVQQNQ